MGGSARGLKRDCVLWKFLSPYNKVKYLRKVRFMYLHRGELISNPKSELFDDPSMDFDLSSSSVELLVNIENIEELYYDIMAFNDPRLESACV